MSFCTYKFVLFGSFIPAFLPLQSQMASTDNVLKAHNYVIVEEAERDFISKAPCNPQCQKKRKETRERSVQKLKLLEDGSLLAKEAYFCSNMFEVYADQFKENDLDISQEIKKCGQVPLKTLSNLQDLNHPSQHTRHRRVVVGTKINHTAYPWSVKISYSGSIRVVAERTSPSGGDPLGIECHIRFQPALCTGAIIHSRYILTAAHCTMKFHLFGLRMLLERMPQLLRETLKEYRKQTFCRFTDRKDRKVAVEIEISDKVVSIELPEEDDWIMEVIDGGSKWHAVFELRDMIIHPGFEFLVLTTNRYIIGGDVGRGLGLEVRLGDLISDIAVMRLRDSSSDATPVCVPAIPKLSLNELAEAVEERKKFDYERCKLRVMEHYHLAGYGDTEIDTRKMRTFGNNEEGRLHVAEFEVTQELHNLPQNLRREGKVNEIPPAVATRAFHCAVAPHARCFGVGDSGGSVLVPRFSPWCEHKNCPLEQQVFTMGVAAYGDENNIVSAAMNVLHYTDWIVASMIQLMEAL